MEGLIPFYTLANFFISLIGASLLLAIFYNIRKRFSEKLSTDERMFRVDNGLLFLGLAVSTWMLSAMWTHLDIGPPIASLGTIVISILNNLCLLIAISYFQHAPSFIYNKKNNLRIIIFIALAVAVITYLMSVLLSDRINGIYLEYIPDLLLSALVSYLLAVSLFKTFINRDLKWVAYISILVIAIMMVSQFPEMWSSSQNGFHSLLIKLVGKTALIFIFLVLATSWVIELASLPTAKEMKLHFVDWSMINLSIPSKDIINETIDFGSKTTQFKNLLKFSVRRKYGENADQCIEVGGHGEITSQTYLSRIIENMNEALSANEAEKLDRKDLFTFIGDGKYRLRFSSENITFDQALLNEFLQSADNQFYKRLCD